MPTLMGPPPPDALPGLAVLPVPPVGPFEQPASQNGASACAAARVTLALPAFRSSSRRVMLFRVESDVRFFKVVLL